ncbi:c-type cytochrome [Coralloluteibacterium thermophilus]|uniref:C-type cytochrome n=1 Tax=Coralloluteibacterium thermophilum TaxID=2707049 RepID=A0ABV9NKX5_9GAMM
MRNPDLVFLKRFSVILGILMAVAVFLIVVAVSIHFSQPREVDPSVQARVEQRIRPVGDVYAGATGAAAKAAAEEAARAAAASQVAFGGTLEGDVIYNGACAACHGTGAGGAPTLTRGEWGARLAQGSDTLHRHAIEGFTGSQGLMPAKGGMPSLTDEQVIAAVDWMVDNLN